MGYFDEPKNILVGLALSEHMGDVNEYLPHLTRLLGLPEPTWHDGFERFVFPWEDITTDEEELNAGN